MMAKKKLRARKVTYDSSAVKWFFGNVLHRIGKPAAIYADGTKMWYHRGWIHRVMGPAVIDSGGTRVWYFRGERIRLGGGPVAERSNGMKEWVVGEEIIREVAGAPLSRKALCRKKMQDATR